MRKVHEKSIVLGVGIGMIITAIAGMIFSAGTNKELSKAEIISLAKGYGLIEQVKFLNDENSASTNSASESSLAPSSSTTTIDSSSDNTERNVIIEIKDGYKSQDVIDILLEKGVITNGEDFSATMDLYKASTSINIGKFKFKKNEDLDYVVKTICNLN